VVRLVLLAVLLICATAPAALAQEPSTDSRPATDSLATDSDTFVLVHGGFVVAGVVDRAPERIAHVVFLDALIPEDGEAVSDLYDPAMAETIRGQVEVGDGWRLPPLPPVTDPRFTPHPSRTFFEPLDLTDAEAKGPARTYIDFTEEEENMHREPLALSHHERGWPIREVDAAHMGIWTDAEAVAEALLAVVGR
jgi:hypothetical protein